MATNSINEILNTDASGRRSLTPEVPHPPQPPERLAPRILSHRVERYATIAEAPSATDPDVRDRYSNWGVRVVDRFGNGVWQRWYKVRWAAQFTRAKKDIPPEVLSIIDAIDLAIPVPLRCAAMTEEATAPLST